LKTIFTLLCGLLISLIGFCQSNYTVEFEDLEGNFKIVRLKNTMGLYSEYLYEGNTSDIEKYFMETSGTVISSNERDTFEENEWLPTVYFDELGAMPSAIIWADSVYVYGGRKLIVLDEVTHTTVIGTLEVSDKANAFIDFLMPLKPNVHQLCFYPETDTILLLCATTGGELIFIKLLGLEIIQEMEDSENASLISSSVYATSEMDYILWILNYWNGTSKIKKIMYDQNIDEYVIEAESIFYENEIIDCFALGNSNEGNIILAFLDRVKEINSYDLSLLFEYPDLIVDKLERQYSHVKNQDKLVMVGNGNLNYFSGCKIEKAFGSCWDHKNGIVYFTGIDDEQKFKTINYSEEGFKNFDNIGAIDIKYNWVSEGAPEYSVAAVGKEYFMGFDENGDLLCTSSMDGFHGYRVSIDFNNTGEVGTSVICLIDGCLRTYRRHGCEFVQGRTVGISSTLSCVNENSHKVYFFYNGDGISNQYQINNGGEESTGTFDELGSVRDCIYNEGKVFAAQYNEFDNSGTIYVVLDEGNYSIDLGEDLKPEIFCKMNEFVYCSASQGNNSVLYQIDASEIYPQISSPVNINGRINAFSVNESDGIVFALLNGYIIEISTDLILNPHVSSSNDARDICYNTQNNKIYVADYSTQEIDVYNNNLNYLSSINVTGYPKKLFYNQYQDNIYLISDKEHGLDEVAIICCETGQVNEAYEIRKSDGTVYNGVNDQLYIYSDFPSEEENLEFNLKVMDNWQDNFSNQVNMDNFNYSDILIRSKNRRSNISFDPVTDKIYRGNAGFCTASVINTYKENITITPNTWKWLSFPRMERYHDEPFDAVTLLERIQPWPPNYLKMMYETTGNSKFIEYINESWNIASNLTSLQSSQGYKINYQKSGVESCTLRMEGAKEDYDLIFDLEGTGDHWVGYFLDKPQYPEDCLPADLWNILTQIRTQTWSMTKIFTEPNYWFIKGTIKPFHYGDLVILKTSQPYLGFQWQMGSSQAGQDEEIPLPGYFSFEEQSDYIPFYIEMDSASEIAEIAVLADGIVKGASNRSSGDTLVEVKGYLEDVPEGAVISFETWDGYKSTPAEKGSYIVIDHKHNAREKRNIYTGENEFYYHVSFKSKETYEVPAEISWITCQPNPLNENTEFSFMLNLQGNVSISIYDIRGNLVKNLIEGNYPEGHYRFTWNRDNEAGNRILPGIYIYKTSFNYQIVQTDKVVVSTE
jgi:hypothetical protein